LFVGPDPFFNTRRVQLAVAAARHAVPATYSQRDYIEAGGLMSYGVNVADAYRHIGVYARRILKGEKPADLPVVQSSKFELVINVQTARTLGPDVAPPPLPPADQGIGRAARARSSPLSAARRRQYCRVGHMHSSRVECGGSACSPDLAKTIRKANGASPHS